MNKPQLQSHFDSVAENVHTIHDFLKTSYKETKKEIVETISFFKDEISNAIDKTGNRANLLSLPINNFLKDISQMDREFQEEIIKNREHCICLDGKMIPANEALRMAMEENY